MKTESLRFLPVARREGIVTKQVEGELLIYDRIRDKAHCLNRAAAEIWQRCDGNASAAEIARSLASNRSPNASSTSSLTDERVVWLALAELRRKHLLEEPAVLPEQIAALTGMSRREAIRRIGLGAAIALPIVVTITAPTPAQAGSCRHNNGTCNTGADCCSGTCDVPNHKCVGG